MPIEIHRTDYRLDRVIATGFTSEEVDQVLTADVRQSVFAPNPSSFADFVASDDIYGTEATSQDGAFRVRRSPVTPGRLYMSSTRRVSSYRGDGSIDPVTGSRRYIGALTGQMTVGVEFNVNIEGSRKVTAFHALDPLPAGVVQTPEIDKDGNADWGEPRGIVVTSGAAFVEVAFEVEFEQGQSGIRRNDNLLAFLNVDSEGRVRNTINIRKRVFAQLSDQSIDLDDTPPVGEPITGVERREYIMRAPIARDGTFIVDDGLAYTVSESRELTRGKYYRVFCERRIGDEEPA